MTCPNCGKTIPDKFLFCTECGTKLEQTNSQSSLNQSNQNSLSSQAQSDYKNVQNNTDLQNDNNTTTEPPVTKPVKKKKGSTKKVLLIIGIILTALAVIAGIVLIAWRPIINAVAPEAYTAKLISDTISEISQETSDIQNNIFGFEPSFDKEFTLNLDLNTKNGDKQVKANATIANYPDKKELLVDGTAEFDDKKITAQGFIDDEYIGVSLPGSDGDYLSVPSKNFGKEFSESDGYISDSWNTLVSDEDYGYRYEQIDKLLKNKDFSYAHITTGIFNDKDATKEFKSVVGDNLIEFLKYSEIGERERIEYDFDDATVKAHQTTIDYKTKDFFDFCINTLKDLKKNKAVTGVLCKSELNSIDELIDALKDEKKDTNIKNGKLTLIEYKGKIVSISVETEQNDSKYWDKYMSKDTVTISSTDKKHLLNGIKIVSESEYDCEDNDSDYDYSEKGKSVSEVELVANWVDENENISVEILIKEDDKNDDGWRSSSTNKLWLDIDYSIGKWKAGFSEKYKNEYSDGDEYTHDDEGKIEGTCKKTKDGVQFGFDHEFDFSYTDFAHHTDYQTWLDEKYEDLGDDFLYDMYQDSSYTSYSSWYNNNAEYYDEPGWEFEVYLEEYYGYEYAYDIYDYEEGYEVYVEDITNVVIDLKLSNAANLKIKNGERVNVLDWNEEKVTDFVEKFLKEIEK